MDTLVLVIHLIANFIIVGIYFYILFFPIVSFGDRTMMSKGVLMTSRVIGLYYLKIVQICNVLNGNKIFMYEPAAIFYYLVFISWVCLSLFVSSLLKSLTNYKLNVNLFH